MFNPAPWHSFAEQAAQLRKTEPPAPTQTDEELEAEADEAWEAHLARFEEVPE